MLNWVVLYEWLVMGWIVQLVSLLRGLYPSNLNSDYPIRSDKP